LNDEPFIRHECVILDASSVINLYAMGCMAEIVRSLPARCAISRYVKEQEARAINEARDENGNRRRIPIDLNSLVEEGLLQICSHNSPSVANTIVVLARAGIRGMGEKISWAIALEKGWGVVLDDHNATTKLVAQMPHIQTLTTLDLLQYWASIQEVSEEVLRVALVNLRIRGNYHIPKRHHLYEWAAPFLADMDESN
jgi:hypothetical protein